MQKTRFVSLVFACSLALGGLSACGDDASGTAGGPDLARDAGTRELPGSDPDVSGAADEGAETDTPVADIGDDEVLPTVEVDCTDGEDNDGDELVDCADVDDCLCEICNDLIDNDTDGRIDCADPDCSDSEHCPERCQNETDDDADGDVDCADSECASTGRCLEPPVTAEAYVFAEMGYFSRLQYPPEGVACCFNYDNDPAPDNQLLDILELIPDYDAQANMDGVVNQGDVALLIEWRDFPDDFSAGGDVDFNIFRGVPVSPLPIGPNENPWADGDGVFRVTADSFDSRGPRVRFEGNLLGTDGVLVGGPHFLDLTVPIPELGLDLTLTLFQARVEVNLREVIDDDPHLETISQIETGDAGAVVVGGGKLGGYVEADDLLGFFNDGAEQCGCAAPVSSPGPLFAYGEQPAPIGAYVVSCNWLPLQPGDSGFVCTELNSALCPFLGQMCGLLPFLPLALDVDANKNSINESVSVGLYFDLTGAALDADPIAD